MLVRSPRLPTQTWCKSRQIDPAALASRLQTPGAATHAVLVSQECLLFPTDKLPPRSHPFVPAVKMSTRTTVCGRVPVLVVCSRRYERGEGREAIGGICARRVQPTKTTGWRRRGCADYLTAPRGCLRIFATGPRVSNRHCRTSRNRPKLLKIKKSCLVYPSLYREGLRITFET
jgi:hypothetical protein